MHVIYAPSDSGATCMPLQRQALHACPCVAYMSMHVIYACHVLQRQALHVCLQRQALHVLHVVGAGGVLPSIDKDVDADLYPPRHVNELSIAVTSLREYR